MGGADRLGCSQRSFASGCAHIARQWEARNALPCFFGGKGMGAQRAAWLCSFRAEAAAAEGKHFALALLDLIKAFERLPHARIVEAARRLGYCLTTLRLSLAAYRLPRALGADGSYSRLVVATLGITAGSGFATVELRVLLHEVVTSTLKAWPLVTISLYVDDTTLEVEHHSCRVALATLAGATDQFVEHLQVGLSLRASPTKSLAVSPSPRMARAVAAACGAKALTVVASAKLLGMGTSGGRRRSAKYLKVRMKHFAKRIPRIHRLRKAGISAARITRAAGTPMITYGAEVSSMAPSHLAAGRRAIARAAAPEGGGKSSLVILYVVDGVQGTLDPAFDANVLPLHMWAMAHWQWWLSLRQLEDAMAVAVEAHPHEQATNWRKVAGPVAALVASLKRIGWTMRNHRLMRSDIDEEFDLLLDPPCVVVQAARRSVRRWRLACIGQLMPALLPQEPDIVVRHDRSGQTPTSTHVVSIDFADVLDSVLTSRSRAAHTAFTPWEAKCRGDLRSAITGGQWPQARLASMHSWTDTSECQLCHGAQGTLVHRHSCSATVPTGGWPLPSEKAARFEARLSAPRRILLQTRGLMALKVSLPARPPGDTFSWVRRLPEDSQAEDFRWFVDGSLFDESKRIFRRTGFGVAAVDAHGSLVAFGQGLPPSWVHDAAGAELWAVCFVLGLRTTSIPHIVSDCKGILDSVAQDPHALTAHDRALARTWNIIRQRVDDDMEQLAAKISWMPSHGAASSIGESVGSNGHPITATMWRANRLVDALAKRTASEHRIPQRALADVEAARQLVLYSVAKLGVVTFRANRHPVPVWRDGTWTTRLARDSTAHRQPPRPPRHSAAQPAAPAPPAGRTVGRLLPHTASHAPAEAAAARGCKRKSTSAVLSEEQARARRRLAHEQLHQLRVDRSEAVQVASWRMAALAARPAAASAGATAAERLRDLRLRLKRRLGVC